MGLGTFKLPIMDSDSDAPYVYVPPADWIDITTVGNNEINLLTSDLSDATLAFAVTTASGTYSIDWGDGTVETGRASTTTYQHTFTTGGTACSRGYNTWKVRIYGASGNITNFNVKRHNLQTRPQLNPLLRAVFGTTGLNGLDWAFSVTSSDLICSYLEQVILPTSNASLTAIYRCFQNCYSLLEVKNFDKCTALTSVTHSVFMNCYKLQEIVFAATLNGITTMTSMCEACYSLKKVTMPTSMNALTSLASAFLNCFQLCELILPTNTTTITSLSSTFSGCYKIRKIVLPTTCNSLTAMDSTFYNCYALRDLTLPTSMVIVNTLQNTFYGCSKLPNISLPATMNSVARIDTCFNACYSLVSITMPSSMSSCTIWATAFQGCANLQSFIFPTTIPVSISSFGNMFFGCYNLESVTGLSGKNLNSLTTCTSMFNGCYKLKSITLWSSSTALTTTSNMFNQCYSLTSITLPNMLAVTTSSAMFQSCYLLTSITNLANLGSTSAAVDMSTCFDGSQKLTTLSIACKLAKIGAAGASGYVNWLTSLRLTHATNTFTGTSPQVSVTYTSLVQADLETLFDDLPNGLASKTIAITGAVGNLALISKTNCGTTVNSNVITQANTSSLVVGMEVTGTGINTARAVTFTDAGDLVTLNSHGLLNGTMVGFTVVTTTTGVVINRKYYVISTATNTFQISDTVGGAAVALTTDGTGTVMFVPTIQTITTNVSFTIDANCSATSAVITGSFALLARRKATTKGWTVTN